MQKKHMLFNNLPLSEQNPAEIKLEAAKNTLLESSQTTTRIGSGTQGQQSWESHSARRAGRHLWSVLETGNEPGVGCWRREGKDSLR